jgi:hypothetical protein
MKKIFTISFLSFSIFSINGQNVGINNTGNAPDPSAALDVVSTNKGVLVPRMTAALRAGIITPAPGLLIYQTDGADGFWYYDGAVWINLSTNPDNDWTISGNDQYSAVSGNVGIGTTGPTEDLHVYRADTDIARVYATGNSQGSGMFYAGQSTSYGGGFVYDGDGTPALVGGTDRITFFRRDNNTDTDVMSYGYSNSSLRISSLAGAGNRVVVANAVGDLITQTVASMGDNLGNHTATTNLNLSNFELDNASYLDVRPGNGYGLRFWSSDSYAINMGNAAEYIYGPVTGYSIKSNMNNDASRGWTWGVDGVTPVAALNTQGAMQIQGSLKVSNNNATGGGVLWSDDGGIYDRNDGYGSIAFSNGVDFEDAQDVTDHMQVTFNNGYPEIWSYNNGATTLTEFRTGIYNNGGTFYSQNQMYARAGIGNDAGDLTLNDNVYVTGNLGVGTAAPGGKLQVNNADGSYMLLGGSGNLSVYNSETFVGEVRLGSAWNRPGVYSSQQLELFSDATGIIFGDSNIERMRLTANGRLGVAETNPLSDLHIQQSGGAASAEGSGGINLENGVYHWRFYNSNNYIRFNYSADGGATYTAKAYVLPTDGSWNQVSDVSVKHNIEDLGSVIPSIMKMKPLKYHYIDNKPSDSKSIGFLAQDAQKLFPETVSHEEGATLLGIDYSKFAVISIKAIQEQQAIIDEQQEIINDQNLRLEKIEKSLNEILKSK